MRFAGAEGAGPTITRTKEQARARAEMLSGLLRDRATDFVEVARRYGDGLAAADESPDGRVLVRGHTELEPNVEAAAFLLHVGEVSVPVETPRGFVIVKRGADQPVGPQRIGARHILIQYVGARNQNPRVTRSKEEAKALAEEILVKLRGAADWNELCAQYSDEPEAADRGGDLGMFAHGQMVPRFERAAFALAVDETSEVVESDFGFHVIRRYR